MVDTIFPANAVGGAPEYSGRMLRQAGSASLAGATSARPLGARSGVRPGTSITTVTATETTWTCGPFAGVADAEAAAEAGPYTFAFDAATSGAVTAADASNPRVDIVYVQIDDPSESDGSTVPAATRLYLAGTAAASPVAPATPARSFVVAKINVPVVGGGSPTVTWAAPYTVAAGGILPAASSATYPANPSKGDYVDDAVLGLRRYSGTAWSNPGIDSGWLTTALTASTDWTINSQFVCKVGRVVDVQLDVTYTGATITVPADGNISAQIVATGLSSAYRPKLMGAMSSGYTGRVGHFAIAASGNVSLGAVSGGASIATGSSWVIQGSWLSAT